MQNKQQMKNFVMGLLRDNLPVTYFYHTPEHTLYVIEKSLEIGRHEQCNDKELELLNLAALWHDTGYIRTYKNHEEESCNLARLYLPEYGVPSADIEKICGMIMATKIPQLPKTKLEEILADADLEYFGTSDFNSIADSLFKELQHINPLFTETAWNQAQISFLKKHHYFTHFCKEFKEPIKMKHLEKLISSWG